MMKRFFAAAALLVAALLAPTGAAQAQSNCKYIAYGTVLTPAQWNYCFAAKNDALGYTPLNKAGDGMLGKLTTLAPSISAGFNLAPGTTPSSPVNGDLWSTTSGLYARINGGTVQVSTTGVVNTVPVTVNLNAASLQSAQTGTMFQGQQADGVVARAELDAFNAIASYSGVVAGGTKASPTAVTSATQLTGINAYAYNGSAFVGPIVSFRTYAAENIASGHQGSKACISTTPNASTTLADHFCQGADGGLTVGAPTGGDEGADTFNSAGNIFQNGVQVSTISNSVSLSNKTLISPVFSGTVAGANTVPLTILAQSAANTMLGNWTGSTANVTANVMPSCSDTGGNHLNYVSGTGITCGSTSISGTFIRNYITGLTLSTAGSSATFSVAAGMAADTTNAQQMVLASSLAKTTSAWTVGAGGCLDTGAIANSTWYTVYEIERTDLTVVDILCSINTTTPTMPANYTFKRRIGSLLTDGSAQWVLFRQYGNYFYWDVAVNDALNAVPGSANNFTVAFTVPTGVNVQPIFSFENTPSAASTVDFYAADGGQSATTSWPISESTGGNVFNSIGQFTTDTTQHLVFRVNTVTNARYSIFTKGWLDVRGGL